MKKTNKPHPLKVFNDNKAMAYKKAGGEMTKFRKSLTKKGDGGRWHAPMMLPENPKTQSSVEGPMNNPMIGPTNAMRENQRVEQISPADALRRAQESNIINARKTNLNDLRKTYNNEAPIMSKPPGVREGRTIEETRLLNLGAKKGGAVKRKKK